MPASTVVGESLVAASTPDGTSSLRGAAGAASCVRADRVEGIRLRCGQDDRPGRRGVYGIHTASWGASRVGTSGTLSQGRPGERRDREAQGVVLHRFGGRGRHDLHGAIALPRERAAPGRQALCWSERAPVRSSAVATRRSSECGGRSRHPPRGSGGSRGPEGHAPVGRSRRCGTRRPPGPQTGIAALATAGLGRRGFAPAARCGWLARTARLPTRSTDRPGAGRTPRVTAITCPSRSTCTM